MALDTQNSRFVGFGKDAELDGVVPVIYDAAITGFRPSKTTDYLITLSGVTGNFNLFTGSTSISNFPANQPITGTVDIKNLSSVQAISGIVTAPVVSFAPTGVTVTGAGSVAAGKSYVQFLLSSSFSGVIVGINLLGSQTTSYTFPLLESNATYGAISYNIPSGNAQYLSF